MLFTLSADSPIKVHPSGKRISVTYSSNEKSEPELGSICFCLGTNRQPNNETKRTPKIARIPPTGMKSNRPKAVGSKDSFKIFI